MAMNWMPRAGRDAAADCVWLPRMLDKARRLVDSERIGRDLLSPYMFGDGDPADEALLRFLRADAEDVIDLLLQEPDTGRVAEALLRRSGRTAEECAAWSAQFLRRQRLLLALLDADEGRWTPGPRAQAVRFLYNNVLMPPVYWLHRNDPHRRLRRGERRSTEPAVA
jgi:hypothetical protein